MLKYFQTYTAPRWRLLAAMCGVMWGLCFVYDLPASLSTPLGTHLDLTDSQYSYLISALYTAYSLPNIVLPFLSGFAVQKYGEKRTFTLTLTFIVAGQLVFAAGVYGKWPVVLIFGRVLFGLGGEVLGVLGNNIVTRWFGEAELTLAMAVILSANWLGGVANTMLTPRWTKDYGVFAATLMADTLALGVSILCAVYVLNKTDVKSEKTVDAESSEGHVAKFLHSISRLPRKFWQLAFICVTVYGSVFPWGNSAQRYLATKYYGGDQTAAGQANSIPNILAAIFVLPFGLLFENPRFKSHCLGLLIASTMILCVHLNFLFNLLGPMLSLCLLGLGHALFGVSLWPGVAVSILRMPVIVASRLQIPLITIEAEQGLLSSRLSSEFGQDPEHGITSPKSPQRHPLSPIPDEEDSSSPTSRNPNFEPLISPPKSEQNSDLVTIGYGIIASLLNCSTSLIPLFLAVVENRAGFWGMEVVFVGLAGVGVLACMGLRRERGIL